MITDKQKIGLSLSLSFCGFCAVFLILVLFGNYSTAHHPPFDPNAKEGTPAVEASLVACEGVPWTAHICDVFAPKMEDGQLYADVYFANDSNNTDYLMLQATDENDHILGETGLIKPNQYIEQLPLHSCPGKGKPMKIQIISYQPETYRNDGSVTLHTVIS